MSIRIDNITRGRFGNKVLQYNSLLQIANNYNIEASCCHWEGNNFFKNIISTKESNKKKELLYCNKIVNNEILDFSNKNYCIDDPAYCLHNIFYQVTKKDPRDFLELKDEFKPELKYDMLYIGIHFRGGDILGGDGNQGREIHDYDYYKHSIDYILKNKIKNDDYQFILCTDDHSFISFKKTIEYLKEKNLKFKYGDATYDTKKHYIYDWGILSECDILINSSSTFCVTAGFLGKKNKYIIHSKKWLDKNINHTPWNNKGEEKSHISNVKKKEYWKYFDNFWINVEKENCYYYCNIKI